MFSVHKNFLMESLQHIFWSKIRELFFHYALLCGEHVRKAKTQSKLRMCGVCLSEPFWLSNKCHKLMKSLFVIYKVLSYNTYVCLEGIFMIYYYIL